MIIGIKIVFPTRFICKQHKTFTEVQKFLIVACWLSTLDDGIYVCLLSFDGAPIKIKLSF